MGICGLLPQLKSITEHSHLSDFHGMTIAVDGYVWLHRGVISCARDICLGVSTSKYVTYFIRQVHLLINNGVKPFIVFDGGDLPEKAGKEAERAAKRERNLKAGLSLLKQGASSKAEQCFQRAVDVTPDMAWQVIKELKKDGIDYLVAPYEADSQLVKLCLDGKCEGVLTEDSDLLTFGCPRVLLKLDYSGHCDTIALADLGNNKGMDFVNWSQEMFVEMCIFTGCDYLPSIPGLGIKRSHALIAKQKCYRKALRCLRFEGKYKIPANYAQAFERAKLTFRYQRVYDIDEKKLVHLRKLPDALQGAQLDYLGPDLDQEVAQGVAEARLHPVTKEPFQEKLNVAEKYMKNQHVLKTFKVHRRKKKEPPPQKNNLLNYMSKNKPKVVLETETPHLVSLMGGVENVNNAFPNDPPIRVQRSIGSFNFSRFSCGQQGKKAFTKSKSVLLRKKFLPEPTTDFFDEDDVGCIKGGLPEMPGDLVSELKIEPKPQQQPRKSKFFNGKRKSLDEGGANVRKRPRAFKPPRFITGKVPEELLDVLKDSKQQGAPEEKNSSILQLSDKENIPETSPKPKASPLLKFMAQDHESTSPAPTPMLLPSKIGKSSFNPKPFVPPRKLKLTGRTPLLERFSCG